MPTPLRSLAIFLPGTDLAQQTWTFRAGPLAPRRAGVPERRDQIVFGLVRIHDAELLPGLRTCWRTDTQRAVPRC